MPILRNCVAAFLKNDEKYLLMKRGENRRFAPGFWSGVGGHMEPCEINDPYKSCYREIEEETGITKNGIKSLELLYIIIRRIEDEIHQNYIFFGETTQSEVTQTDEGTLFWIQSNRLSNREYTPSFTAMVNHYTRRSPGDHAVYIGAADNGSDTLKMSWFCL